MGRLERKLLDVIRERDMLRVVLGNLLSALVEFMEDPGISKSDEMVRRHSEAQIFLFDLLDAGMTNGNRR